jgi:hypothetical protein
LSGTPSTLAAGELDGTCQNVQVTFSTDTLENIVGIAFQLDDICEDIDISMFTNLNSIALNDNKIESIALPVSSGTFTTVDLSNNLFTEIDLSTLSGTITSITLEDNPNLIEVTNPATSGLTTRYTLDDCDITGNLNISMMTGLGGVFNVKNNPNLTSITNPVSTEIFTWYYIYDCDITGTFDMSMLTGLSERFYAYRNSNLTSIINPPSNEVMTQYFAYLCDLGYIDFTVFTGANDGISIRLDNNNMSTAEVNHILVDLDNTGWINGILRMEGTNSAPDGSSGGYDGTTAKSNLITSGWTVTTN